MFVYFIAIGYCCSTLSSSVPWFSGVCTVPFWTERTSCYLMVNFEFGASQTLTLASHFLVLKQILYFHIVVKSSDKWLFRITSKAVNFYTTDQTGWAFNVDFIKVWDWISVNVRLVCLKKLWTLSPCVSKRLLRRKQTSEVVQDHHLIPSHLNSYCHFGFKCWVLDNGQLSEFLNTVVPWLNPYNNTVAIHVESGLTHCCFSMHFAVWRLKNYTSRGS